MNRILVLGGYGAVGIHAVTALVSRGSAVLEVCHRESWRVSSGVPGFGLVSARYLFDRPQPGTLGCPARYDFLPLSCG